MKGKRFGEKRKNNKNRIITICVYAIFIAILGYSGFKIWNWCKDNKRTSKMINQIKETIIVKKDDTETKYKVDFESLLKQNKDTVGWFKVNGTKIEYPIVKARDNDYYLDHSFDKSYNEAGWIFANYKNKFDGTDKNIVIFGHNRRDGTMFGSLKNILEKKWQDNKDNQIIKLYTPKADKEYKVFSVYKILNEEYYIKTDFKDKEYSDFLNTIKNRSIKNFNEDVSEKDNILTLSTCWDNNKYRVVLHAKEIK